MRIFRWLFGNREQSIAAGNEGPSPLPSADGELMPAGAVRPHAAADVETDNLRRWREAGHARAWVEAQNGQWDHAAWLALLHELQHSSFWPLHTEALGMALEETRQEWLRSPK